MKQKYHFKPAHSIIFTMCCMLMVSLMEVFIVYLNGVAVDEERHLALAHQNYRSGKYREALEHGNVVYEKNPRRTDNLLLLGAIYYQVTNSFHVLLIMGVSFFYLIFSYMLEFLLLQIRNYDMCIAKNEEALAIDPHFAECYGNMANAWKVV